MYVFLCNVQISTLIGPSPADMSGHSLGTDPSPVLPELAGGGTGITSGPRIATHWRHNSLYIRISDSICSLSMQSFGAFVFAMHKNGDSARTPRAGGLDSALGDTGPSGRAPYETYFLRYDAAAYAKVFLLASRSRSWLRHSCG